MTLIIVTDSGVEFTLEGTEVDITLPDDYDISELADDLATIAFELEHELME